MKSAMLKEQITSCTACQLYKGCSGPVPFRGRPCSIMIIGEAPGRQEDATGRPFVGPAGKLLWGALGRAGLSRAQCFVANTVCCWPHRTPNTDEVYSCRGNLYAQVEHCNPDWILALGAVANQSLGGRGTISVVRGEPYELAWFRGDQDDTPIWVYPTLHPAAVLRDQTKLRRWRQDLADFVERATNG